MALECVCVCEGRGEVEGGRRGGRVVVCDGRPYFLISATCSVLSCFAVSDCHSPFSVICKAFCSDACWLKANQSVCTHEMSRKRDFIETISAIIIFLTLLSETIQE